MNKPLKGEIWLVKLDPNEGREQSKTRPCLIISNNKFNKSAVDLVKQVPLHIMVSKQITKLTYDSFIIA